MVVIFVVIVMMTMFTLAIMAVNPVMAVFGPVTWHPHHLPIAFPITRAMGVIGTVADFDDDSVSFNDGRKHKADRKHRSQQEFVLNHTV